MIQIVGYHLTGYISLDCIDRTQSQNLLRFYIMQADFVWGCVTIALLVLQRWESQNTDNDE